MASTKLMIAVLAAFASTTGAEVSSSMKPGSLEAFGASSRTLQQFGNFGSFAGLANRFMESRGGSTEEVTPEEVEDFARSEVTPEQFRDFAGGDDEPDDPPPFRMADDDDEPDDPPPFRRSQDDDEPDDPPPFRMADDDDEPDDPPPFRMADDDDDEPSSPPPFRRSEMEDPETIPDSMTSDEYEDPDDPPPSRMADRFEEDDEEPMDDGEEDTPARAARTAGGGGTGGGGSACSADAMELVRLVNEYRAENGKDSIPASSSMCITADAHIQDSIAMGGSNGECNLHSWLDCCFTSDFGNSPCMWDKPSEYTCYEGNGYENSAGGGGGDISPARALDMWKGSDGHNNVILNLANWEDIPFQAVGAGFGGGFVHLWFGQEPDCQD